MIAPTAALPSVLTSRQRLRGLRGLQRTRRVVLSKERIRVGDRQLSRGHNLGSAVAFQAPALARGQVMSHQTASGATFEPSLPCIGCDLPADGMQLTRGM